MTTRSLRERQKIARRIEALRVHQATRDAALLEWMAAEARVNRLAALVEWAGEVTREVRASLGRRTARHRLG